MKISKLIELLHPYQDCDAEVDVYDSGSGDHSTDKVTGVRIELNEEGQATCAVILL